MKNLILVLAIVASLYSCTKETDDIITDLEITGKWDLVKMTGSEVGSVYTGSQMEWQEYYILSDNKIFTKTRVRGDNTITVSGTYTLSDSRTRSQESSLKYLELNHNSENIIIGSCSSDKMEYLYFSTNNQLISSWNACDGPGLEYIKSK